MPSPQTRRLTLDEQALEQRLRNWPGLQITGKADASGDVSLHFNLKGLYVAGCGEILEQKAMCSK